MVVDVCLLLEQCHRRVNYIHGSLGGRDPSVRRGTRGIRGSGERAEISNRSRSRVVKIHLRCVGISTRLDRPSFHATGRTLHSERDWRAGSARLSIGYGSEDALYARGGVSVDSRGEGEHIVARGCVSVCAVVIELL